MTWVGLKHYATAAEDPLLRLTLFTSLKYFFLKVPVQMALAFALALFVSRPGKGIGVVRTLILLPTITSFVVASVLWGMMYHPNIGLFNSVLEVIGIGPQPFLRSADQALPAVVVITIWKEVGLSMLFFMAGLLAIPPEYYDAANVDGANSWQLTRHITIPLLRNTTAFVLVTSTIHAFKVFVPIKVLTDGGPSNATRVILLYIFQLAFKFTRMDYASTVSAILAVILLIISIIQMRVSREQTT